MSTGMAHRTALGRILWLIWGGTLGSLVIYLAMATLLDGLPTPDMPPFWTRETVLNLCYGTAIALLALTIVLRAGSRRGETHEPSPGTRAFVITLILLVVAESIGLLGLFLYWLIRERNPFYVLLATSLTALLIHRPGRHPDRRLPP